MMSENFQNFQISKADFEEFVVKISSDLDHFSYVNFKTLKFLKVL